MKNAPRTRQRLYTLVLPLTAAFSWESLSGAATRMKGAEQSLVRPNQTCDEREDDVLLVVCLWSVTPFRLERVGHDNTSGDVHQA